MRYYLRWIPLAAVGVVVGNPAAFALSSMTNSAGAAQEASDSTPDRLARWQSRWDENRIGWHQDETHEALLRFGDLIIPGFTPLSSSADNKAKNGPNVCPATKAVRIFFPLCGKSRDMAFLARQEAGVAQVVGNDGVLKSLETFASEHADLEIVASENPNRLVGKNIMLVHGDFFQLNEEATGGKFESIVDRASLVAIDPSMRKDYVQVLRRLLQPSGRILLIVIERLGGDLTAGPPFSVPEAQVRELYENQDWVESVTLLEDDGEKATNEGREMRSLFFLIQAK